MDCVGGAVDRMCGAVDRMGGAVVRVGGFVHKLSMVLDTSIKLLHPPLSLLSTGPPPRGGNWGRAWFTARDFHLATQLIIHILQTSPLVSVLQSHAPWGGSR